MASSPRIDELRKKFDENPRRYFAPLANEYRKAGDFQQAIAICREYLPQQPGHMSGHIVFGQALYEARQFDEAKAVFETALSLDPENLIALKHLGDIALILGDTTTAKNWYQKILDADPRNEEILAQLAKLEQKKAGAKVGATMVMQAVPRPGAPPKEPKPAAPSPPAAPPVPPKPAAAVTPPAGIPTNLSNQKTAPIPVAGVVGSKTEPMPAVQPPAPTASAPGPAVTADSPTQEVRLDTIATHVPPAAPVTVEPALGLEPTSFGATTPPPSTAPGLEIDAPVSAPKEAPPAGGFSLEGLETTSLAAEAPPPAPPAAPAPTIPQAAPAEGLVDLDLSMGAPGAAPAPAAAPVAAQPPASEGLIDLELPAPSMPATAPTPPAPPPPPPPAATAPVAEAAEVIDLTFAPPAETAAVAPPPAPVPAAAEPTDELPMLDLGETPAVSAASAPVQAPPAIPEIELPAAPVAAQPPVPEPTAAPSPPFAAAASPPIAPPAPAAAAGPFVTETMAELYLQQGHREEALKVYQALLAQKPHDASIRAKVESLSAPPAPAQPAGPTIRDVLYIIAVRRPGYRADTAHFGGNGAAAAAVPAQPALAADGLAALFGAVVVGDYDEYAAQMLALAFMHGNGDGEPTAAGVPAHQATGDLSLNTVFRGEASAEPQQPSNFSFDQFFSQRVTADNPVIPHPQAASESQEDVAHFTQWLEGLKKK